MKFVLVARHLSPCGCTSWLYAVAVAMMLLACTKPAQVVPSPVSPSPSGGLFKVVDRYCENPLDEPDNCPLVEYVELTRSTLPSLAQHPAVLIFWLGPQPGLPDYTYEVWPLDGRFVSREEYVLHDEGAVRDWLVLLGGEPREYDLESFKTEQRREIRLKSRLSLQRAARTPAIDSLLRLDPE